MSMNELQRRQARHQATVCSVALVGIACIVFAIHGQPDGATELKIPVAMLRSDAGELALLLHERDHLPRAFLSAHSARLLESVDQAHTELDTLQLQEGHLLALRSAAQTTGADLSRIAGALARETTDASDLPGSLLKLQRQLRAVEANLEQ
jgi:hypothetical protein